MSVIFFNYFPSAEKLCRITSIVVDRASRGTGIGSKLIDYAKSVALAEKCSVLEVTTSLRREKTQTFYESIGFKKTSYKYVQRLENNT
ncbi:GNAT family N-acetyltransferase [Vibrio parahaemolyticus]|nr:GNAT family N-acetyltransferase [Vibrio parahaemolyticus]